MSFYTESSVIDPGQAFFVVANSETDLTFSNNARLHHFDAVQKSNIVENNIVFDVTNGEIGDKVGFIFNSAALATYIHSEDVLEIPYLSSEFLSFSSLSSDFKGLPLIVVLSHLPMTLLQ